MLLGEHNLVWDKIQQMHSMAQLEKSINVWEQPINFSGREKDEINQKLTKELYQQNKNVSLTPQKKNEPKQKFSKHPNHTRIYIIVRK